MPALDFSHLSPQERLDLIGEIWDSLGPDAVTVTPALRAEFRRRLATLDADIAAGREAAEVLGDVQARLLAASQQRLATIPAPPSVAGKSIADLTESELAVFARRAGMQAYQSALRAGVPVPFLSDGQLRFDDSAATRTQADQGRG